MQQQQQQPAAPALQQGACGAAAKPVAVLGLDALDLGLAVSEACPLHLPAARAPGCPLLLCPRPWCPSQCRTQAPAGPTNLQDANNDWLRDTWGDACDVLGSFVLGCEPQPGCGGVAACSGLPAPSPASSLDDDDVMLLPMDLSAIDTFAFA